MADNEDVSHMLFNESVGLANLLDFISTSDQAHGLQIRLDEIKELCRTENSPLVFGERLGDSFKGLGDYLHDNMNQMAGDNPLTKEKIREVMHQFYDVAARLNIMLG